MIPFHGNQYPGQGGHYESWFVRANDPYRRRALWIRYTQFIADDGRRRLGEIWAVWFDGERQVAVKEEFPLEHCLVAADRLAVEIGDNRLEPGKLHGGASLNGHRIEWDLRYQGGQEPLLLLPEDRYRASFPKAKSLVSRPAVRVSGQVRVDGDAMQLEHWPGSENHNWGKRHTDQYAWGQVAAFDGRPDAFLECATARVWFGPVPTPWLSLAVLRLDGRTYAFNRVGQALRSRGRYRFFQWRLECRAGDNQLRVDIDAPREAFTALTYYNPPGGNKTCLNSKLAHARVSVIRSGHEEVLHSEHGAAFEILTDRDDHGVPISV